MGDAKQLVINDAANVMDQISRYEWPISSMYILDEKGNVLNGFEAFHRLTLEVERNPKDEYVRVRDVMFQEYENLSTSAKADLYDLCKKFGMPETYREEGFADLCKLFVSSQHSKNYDLSYEVCDPNSDNPFDEHFMCTPVPNESANATQSTDGPDELSVDEWAIDLLYIYEMPLQGLMYRKGFMLFSGFEMFYHLTADLDEQPNHESTISAILDIYDNLSWHSKDVIYDSCQEVEVPTNAREAGFAEFCQMEFRLLVLAPLCRRRTQDTPNPAKSEWHCYTGLLQFPPRQSRSVGSCRKR